MVKKKPARKKPSPAKKRKAAVVRRKTRPARKKPVAAKKKEPAVARRKSKPARKRAVKPEERVRRDADFDVTLPPIARGLGLESGGQSGDTAGLSRGEQADSESVEELLEEGQAYEAGIVSGVENAPDADESEVTTRQFPEDDVPQEYLDEE